MKKFLLCIAMVAFGFTANAQKSGFNLGADVTYNFDAEVFGLMGEANYLFEVGEGFRAGPVVSYQYVFGQEVDLGGGNTITTEGSGDFTAGAAGRFNLSDEFVIGADLGYYFDASTFYYRPMVGYMISENAMLQLSLPSNEFANSLALGIMFGL